jgi:hypothetical protein
VPAFLILHREFITPTDFIRLLILRYPAKFLLFPFPSHLVCMLVQRIYSFLSSLKIDTVEGPNSDNATEDQIKLFEQDKVFIRTRYARL